MYYSEDVIEEVRDSNDIVDVISGYVKLQKKGSSYMGLCPFHNEKTPSFSVNQSRQMYHCFGCGASGNVFTFLMEYENYTFPEAVEFLAQRAGVKLPEEEPTRQQKKEATLRQTLYEINKKAATYYYYQLKRPQGEAGRAYFAKRQLTQETIQKFGLGYANKYGNDLYQYLRKEGYDDEILKKSGLVTIQEKTGAHDKFWNRVMYPIMDIHNKVIGFGGRVMDDGKPKYLNSPETLLFDKSRNLYALNLARRSKRPYFIICEGYMDVITMHQAGFDSAVASLGTAFTSGQAELLKRYTKEVYLAYDNDEAGMRATLRVAPMVRAVGLRSRVIHMEPYKDADEFIKDRGAQAFEERIQKAENTFLFEISIVSKKYDLKDPDGRTAFTRETAKRLVEFEEEDERENYIEAIAGIYGISTDQLRNLTNKYGLISSQTENASRSIPSSIGEEANLPVQEKQKHSLITAQKMLLTMLADDPTLFDKISDWIGPEDFTDEPYHQAALYVFEEYQEKGTVTPARIVDLFEEKEEQKKVTDAFLTHLPEDFDQASKQKAFNEIIRKVKSESLKKQKKDVRDVAKLQEITNLQRKLQELHISL